MVLPEVVKQGATMMSEGGGRQGHFFAAPAWAEANASDKAIICMIIECQRPTSALFDTCSIFSYVSIYYVARLGVTLKSLSSLIQVYTPVGDFILVDWVCRGCVITL